MSNTNYDVELPISYDYNYRHYLTNYDIDIPWYKVTVQTGELAPGILSFHYTYYFAANVSFDEESEISVTQQWEGNSYASGSSSVGSRRPEQPYWISVPASGIYSKIYLRNPYRGSEANFTTENTHFRVTYNTKAAFEIKFNIVGFAANENASFRCSTIQKNTFQQYEWVSATVYYKKTTDSTYQSVEGTISGTWSDYIIGTNISLEDNTTYDIYIRAVADDDTVAETSVEQFTNVDAVPVSTCIAPSGTFEQGEVTFIWSHSTIYGTPQYAYDLQFSTNNGASWTAIANHEVTSSTSKRVTLPDAGVYLWRVRTYNTNDVSGEWGEATFVNNVPANPPTNLIVDTKGRPTLDWAAVSQTAYQVQFILNNEVVYDSNIMYTPQNSHFVNQYLTDGKAYIARVRTYNALGDVSEWVETGYQQPEVEDIEFYLENNPSGGATITIKPNDIFVKYFLLRNNKLIAQFTNGYNDRYANGPTAYSVIGVTSDEQSDIKTQTINLAYPVATLVTLEGQYLYINRRVNQAYEIQVSNTIDVNNANYIGDDFPSHYPSDMRLKTFSASFFDEDNICDSLLGNVVFYADNFGNGGYCLVKGYEKTDNYIRNSRGAYANEVDLTLEVTNYDDTIQFPV